MAETAFAERIEGGMLRCRVVRVFRVGLAAETAVLLI